MIQAQRGVGLIEVLVALLLLAVAVLGFSAMQLTALKATDESVMRSRAITMMRGAAEMMRANPDGIAAFKDALNGTATTVNNNDTINLPVPPATTGTAQAITKDSCMTGGTPMPCTIKQLAVKDALSLKQYATDNEIKIRLETCPATSLGTPMSCLIAAWGDSNATIGTGDNDCIDSTGVYKKGSTCFVLETY